MQVSRPVHLRVACLSSPMINDHRDAAGQPLNLCSIDTGPPFTSDVLQHLGASWSLQSDTLKIKYVLKGVRAKLFLYLYLCKV